MALQVGIGVYGFYAIRTFEKYTVPPTIAIMVLMSILAWTQPGVVNWNLTTSLPPGAHLAMLTLLMTAIGVGWGISWVTWASDYSRFVPRSVSSSHVFWYSAIGMYVPTVWLAILGATLASVTLDTDPAKMVSAVFGGVASILVLLMVLHGPIATNILNVYSAALAALSAGLKFSRSALAILIGIAGYLVTIYFVFAPSFAKAFDNWMISLLLWMSPWAGVVLADYFIKRKRRHRCRRTLPRRREERLRRHQLGRDGRVPDRAGRGLVRGRRPRAGAARTDLARLPRRRGPELARRHRRRGRALSGARRTNRDCALRRDDRS